MSRYRVQILTIFFACLALWLAWTWTLVAQRVMRYYCPFPTWDYWRVPYDLYFSKIQGLQVFLRPHNEHRIIFPEIVFLLDLLFHGRLILPIIVSFFCYLATAATLACVFCLDVSLPLSVRAFGAFLAAIILGWQGSAVVIADPFLLQWTLSSLCAVLSIVCLARSLVPAALVAAVVATYSSGNCLVLWPILLLEAWHLRFTRRQITAVCPVAAISVALYFVDYHSAGNSNLLAVFANPLKALGFFASYMGMPFGLGKLDAAAFILGTLNVLLAALLFPYARRTRLLTSATVTALFGVYLFTVLTAVVTTMGRVGLNLGYADAKASRFWVVQLLSWATLVLLCVYFASKARSQTRTPVTVGAVLVFLVAFGTLKLRSSLDYEDDQFAKSQLATLGFENGLQDTGLARRIFPSPSLVFTLLPYLQTHHLSIYSGGTANWLGKPARTLGPIVDQPHSGAVTYTFPVEGGIELAGWADPDRRGSQQIILVNEKGNIAGFGGKLPAAFPLDLRNGRTPFSEGWVAFANLKYAAQSITPFLLNRGSMHPMGSPIAVNSSLTRVPQDVGLLLTTFEWQMDPTWKRDAIPALRDPGNVPRGAVFGTWSRDNRNTGDLTSSAFDAPITGCLLIPVSHGMFVPGLSLSLVDASDGRVVQTIPMQDGDMGWQFWRLVVQAATPRLRIVARDQGSGWDEWLALATPSACDTPNDDVR